MRVAIGGEKRWGPNDGEEVVRDSDAVEEGGD